MEPLTLDSTDVELVEHFVSKLYSKMRIGAVGDSTRAQITRRVLGAEIGFDDLDYSFEIGYAAEPPEQVIICDVISNTIDRHGDATNNHLQDTFGPGDQFLISRPGLPYGGLAHSTRLRFTLLDPAIFSRVASTGRDDAAAEPVQLLSHRPVSRSAQAHLQRTIAYVRDEIMCTATAFHSPLLAVTASQLLAASVLHAYPNSAVTAPAPNDDRDAHPTALARAVAFIENNPESAVTLTDIARAAYVTPRALQLAFRQHLATTPMAYLRRVRLDHAHNELRAATRGSGNTVTDIAARWGFTNTRFAQHYRAEYGELPSQTLNN